MGAAKISMQKVLATNPDINALALASEAIADHSATNGCEFEENAAVRALNEIGIDHSARAADLTDDTLTSLGDRLEAMELNCPGKTQSH